MHESVALVIGNAQYPGRSVLKNPANDARDLAAKLEGYGFKVTLVTDATHHEMDRQLDAFKAALRRSDVGLFFFAGHGVQVQGTNYLFAIDSKQQDETEAKHSSLSLNKVIDVLEKSQISTKIIILDACRDNPWEYAWNRGVEATGLAPIYAPKGTIIGFATSPGEKAKDGVGRNGPYTGAILRHIDTPDCSIEAMFKRVRNSVAAETNGAQTTWEHTSLSGEFYFNLSLGKKITAYNQTALADALFNIDSSKAAHRAVKVLKSYTYDTQNTAIAMLTPASVEAMSLDDLFVVGRNIYQAACGNAHSAAGFVKSFQSMTSSFEASKRKALLDGMLFEVFFDPMAGLRNEIKEKFFNELFELQKFDQFKDSFDFIADCLVKAGGKFYAIPGKGHEVSITIAAKKHNDAYRITSVYEAGADILRPESDEVDQKKDDAFHYRYAKLTLQQVLSQQMMVPVRLLKIQFSPPSAASSSEFGFPMNWTVKKI